MTTMHYHSAVVISVPFSGVTHVVMAIPFILLLNGSGCVAWVTLDFIHRLIYLVLNYRVESGLQRNVTEEMTGNYRAWEIEG